MTTLHFRLVFLILGPRDFKRAKILYYCCNQDLGTVFKITGYKHYYKILNIGQFLFLD